MKRRRETGASEDQAESPTKKANSADEQKDASPSRESRDRDEDFYFDDGDLVLRVEKTLFKINRFALRDSLYFRSTLAARDSASGNAQLNGSDDSHPLILYDHSVEAFKALLVFLHAVPDVLLKLVENLKKADALSNLLRLAAMSNRYQFESMEKVISDLLHHYLKHYTDHLHNTASVGLFKRALEAITVQQSSVLRDGFSRIFATKILNKTFPPIIALEFADTHGLRILQGAVYYALLYFTKNTNAPQTLEARKFDAGVALTMKEKSRLLHGSWSLSQCTQLLTHTPPLSIEKCRALGIMMWYKTTYGVEYCTVPLSHPLAMLEDVRKQLAGCLQACHSDVERRVSALDEFDEVVRRFQDCLMDHFDPPS